jgi:hypothetical protein
MASIQQKKLKAQSRLAMRFFPCHKRDGIGYYEAKQIEIGAEPCFRPYLLPKKNLEEKEVLWMTVSHCTIEL